MNLELKTQSGMSIVSKDDIEHLKKLKTHFKRFRDTNAVVFQYIKEDKPVDNLISKLWRISDEIMDEMRRVGEVEDAKK